MIRAIRAAALRLVFAVQASVFVLGVGLATTAPTQAEAQAFVFNDVRVEGNQRIETATILTYLGFGRGDAVSGGQLNDALQRLQGTGLFESVDLVPQGRTLIIRVDEFPTINRINFEGNARLGDNELSAVVRSQPRRVYSPAQAEQDTAAIVQAYADQGRINASVTPRIIERSDNRVDLVFEIFEGGVSEVQRISFVGNREFSDRRLRRVLETKQAGILRAIIQRDTFIADRVAFDQQVLTDFYRSRGYVDFEVQNVDVALTRERDAYLITFNVQEGQQFRFGEVTVTSEIAEADPLEFERAIRLRPGVVYSPSLVEQDIARLERMALRQGINFVQVEPRITRNDRDLTLDLELALVPGERIFVERIDIEGNTTTLDRVVRSQFEVVEGDPFNPRQIRQSAERIRALGFFGDVDVSAREGSAPDQVLIDVNLTEQSTGALTFGGNYSTDTGFTALISYDQANLLGRGQALSFNLNWGADTQFLSFNFTEPRLLGRDVAFGLGIDYNRSDNAGSQAYDTNGGQIRPSLTFPVSESGRLGVYYRYEFLDLEVDATASPYIQADEGSYSTNSLGYFYSYDTRRTGLDPTGGVLLRFGQEFGVGDNSYVRTTASATAQKEVFNEEVTLRATIEGGALFFNDGQSLITDRFFLNSRQMRGFQPGGIGPRDSVTGDALGGNFYAVARLEAEFPLGLPEEYGISGGVFLDYGSVWDVGRPADSNAVLHNDFTPRAIGGLSIFWTTPIGPLRFNFTEPLDVQSEDVTRSFELTISTQF